LRRNVQHSQEGSEQHNEAFRSAATALSFDEDDKESFLDEPHSSPESSPEAHHSSTRLRQVETNPVPVPGQHSGSSSHSSIASPGNSDSEGGRGSEEEGEKVEEEGEEKSGRKFLSEVPSESSGSTATPTSSLDVSQEPT